MLTLYDNPFSPFARKVRMVLEHKDLAFETVDGLQRGERDALAAVNGRVEVPALDHDGVVVVGSADIAAYLDRAFPERPVYPVDASTWVRARAWERCSDTVVDAIVVDVSYWMWAVRPDKMPEGLLDAAKADLGRVYDALERALTGHDWICGALSIADMALFPHLSGSRALGVGIDGDRTPQLLAWYKRCRAQPLFAADVERAKVYLSNPSELDLERDKIFWRGDRIEWLLSRGFHGWFAKEIEEGRVLWPGLGIPA